MNRLCASAAVTACLVLTALPVSATTFEFTGTASTEQDTPIYTESHRITGTCMDGVFRPQDHQVDYARDGSTQFASKRLVYNESTLRPTVDFRQPDFDERLNIRYPDADRLVVNWEKTSIGTKTFNVPYSTDVVVDAGFDNLVRRHWSEMLKGQSVQFRFLGPTRGEHYAFVLETVESSRVNADYVLQIRPTGLVLRFLVDPIVLGYNKQGALTDYYGLSNIRKDNESNYTVHIRYNVNTYPGCELTP